MAFPTSRLAQAAALLAAAVFKGVVVAVLLKYLLNR
jgi:hypothetical protein